MQDLFGSKSSIASLSQLSSAQQDAHFEAQKNFWHELFGEDDDSYTVIDGVLHNNPPTTAPKAKAKPKAKLIIVEDAAPTDEPKPWRPSLNEVRDWCHKKYGKQWWMDDKKERKKEAQLALIESHNASA